MVVATEVNMWIADNNLLLRMVKCLVELTAWVLCDVHMRSNVCLTLMNFKSMLRF